MWISDLRRCPRTLKRGAVLALSALLATGLLAGLTAPTASAVGPFDGASTVVTVVGANNVGQKDIPLGLAAYSNAITDMSAGQDHALALDRNGRLFAWGDNSEGEGFIYVPQQKPGYKAVSAGYNYSLAINASGQVEAWGSSRFDLTTPPDSLQGRTVTAISAGTSLALALDSTGRVHVWGDFSLGQRDIPQELFSKRVVKIAAGGAFAIAVTEDKQVFAWGYGLFGQTTVPPSLQGRTIEEIDAGGAHTVALLNDGSIVSWGDNSHGQLLTPTTSTRWHHVSAGSGFTVASGNKDATVKVWGDGASTTFANLPRTGMPVAQLTAGGNFIVYGRAQLTPAQPPVISGSGRVGAQLTATHGTWAPLAPSQVQGQWYTAEKGVGVGTTFTPTADLVGKKLYFASLGQREGYEVLYLPADVTVLPGLMVKQQPQPTVTGFAQVGKVLTATATFSPTPDRIQYDWHVDGKFKLATDDGRYTVQPGDLGSRITVHATAFKAGYDQAPSGFSEPTASVTLTPRLSVVSPPKLTGGARVGQAVTVVPPTTEPAATSVSYQWMRDGDEITGATDDTYVPTPEDKGLPLWVASTLGRDGYDNTTSPSAAVLVEAGEFTSVGVPAITGTPAVGSTMQATVTSTPSAEATHFDWYAGDSLRSSGPAAYQVTQADAGLRLSVVARVLRAGYDPVTTQRSVPTDVVTGKQLNQPEPTPAVRVIAAASVSGKAVAGGVLKAQPPTTDVPATATYQWLRDGQAIRSATAQSFRSGPDDIGRRLAVVVTVHRAGWTAATSTSVPTAPVAKAAPVVKATSMVRAGRTIVKVRASAAGLPALRARLTVVVGGEVVLARLVAGRAVVSLPRTSQPLKVKLAATPTTRAAVVKVRDVG